MDALEYLARLPFAHCASKEDMQAMAQYAYFVSFSKGEVIYTCSQAEAPGLALVISGALSASMISDEGKQLLLYRLGPGECDLFTDRSALRLLSSDAMVEAETAGMMLMLPPLALEKPLKDPLAENALQRMLLSRCAQVMGAMERLLFSRVDKRLAAQLLQAARNGEVRMTHEQLARDISCSREVASRALARFVKAGWVDTQRGRIVINRPDALDTLRGQSEG